LEDGGATILAPCDQKRGSRAPQWQKAHSNPPQRLNRFRQDGHAKAGGDQAKHGLDTGGLLLNGGAKAMLLTDGDHLVEEAGHLVAGQQHECFAPEIRTRELLAVRQPMPPWNHHDKGLVVDLGDLQSRLVDGPPHEADVKPASPQSLELLIDALLGERQRNAW
jgi:hypothetical protein